ncbi:hypothetical protein CXP39_02585 [Mesoplasma syrphidae]|uniref:Uncharacterized protein n=1 Tax=Mesoplasma syrphidae TaxID=225999 RepID=A0A2K9BRP1_9MOLU|nr:hypothetical protein [Mesoplasma syrphidae]AUF83672.1 hypothetical protein CXP39_02585 [Mesoplasma syrphidae]
MGAVFYANIVLWIVDTFALFSILFVYLVTTKSYNSYQVPRISTYNDVIKSSDIERLLIEFKTMFNLGDYDIIYSETDKYVKIFKNLNKRKKKIIISKKIFESVGYELDYLIARIWLSAKTTQKDNKVLIYKLTVIIFPVILVWSILILYILQTGVFFTGINYHATYTNEAEKSWLIKTIVWLWKTKFIGFLMISFLTILVVDFLVAYRYKEIIENEYNNEIIGLVKTVMEDFYKDFIAARTYAQDIKYPFVPILKTATFWEQSKWLGPFVHM